MLFFSSFFFFSYFYNTGVFFSTVRKNVKAIVKIMLRDC